MMQKKNTLRLWLIMRGMAHWQGNFWKKFLWVVIFCEDFNFPICKEKNYGVGWWQAKIKVIETGSMGHSRESWSELGNLSPSLDWLCHQPPTMWSDSLSFCGPVFCCWWEAELRVSFIPFISSITLLSPSNYARLTNRPLVICYSCTETFKHLYLNPAHRQEPLVVWFLGDDFKGALCGKLGHG